MSVTFAKGFRAAGVEAGISAVDGKKDLALVVNDGPLDAMAGVFTPNRFCAAPVQWTRSVVADGHAKAVILNSGGANACTGQAGYDQSAATAATVAGLLGCTPEDVAVCSTGLIGELLPLDNVLAGAAAAHAALADYRPGRGGRLARHHDHRHQAENRRDRRQRLPHRRPWVKGSGHDRPPAGHHAVRHHHRCGGDRRADAGGVGRRRRHLVQPHRRGRMHVHQRHGAAHGPPAPRASNRTPTSSTRWWRRACATLARQIIGDGEGASHDVRITVAGATSEDAALACGRAVAASNLLKCAIAGNDPNWGARRQLPGHGSRNRGAVRPNRVTVDINGVRICDGGKPGRDRSEVDMTPREVHIDIDLNAGDAEATVWTDDLTHEYVHINADYES